MKKFFFIVLLVLTSGLALAQITLNVPDVNAAPGSKVIVPVSISDGADVTAIQFALAFNTTLLSIPAQGSVLGGGALTDHSVGANLEDGKFTVVIFSGSLASMAPGPGTVVSIVFEVAAGAALSSSTMLAPSEIQASDTNGDAVPVVSSEGTLTISNAGNTPSERENRLIFSQIANGTFEGGSFLLTLILVNRTAVTSNGKVSLFKSDGTPFVVTLTDGTSDSSFEFTVQAGGSAFLRTDGSGGIAAGYAVMDATGPLGGILILTQRDGGGNITSEAGVGASPVDTRFSIPVLFNQQGTNTGIAFVNALSQTVQITLIRRDEAGMELEQKLITLQPGEHSPQFANELFDQLAGVDEFQGSIEITSSAPISAVALKVQGVLLTTFPVIVIT